MRKPTIHLNGTGRDALFNGYAEAARALRTAIEKLCDAAPNARDYYVQEDANAFREACAEQMSRVGCMRSVLAEIEELAEHVMEVGK